MGPVWPAQAPVPLLAASVRAGEAEDFAVVKRRKFQGFRCNVIVYINSNVDYGLFCSKSRGVFANVPAHACFLAVGCLALQAGLAWAVPMGRRMLVCARYIAWAALGQNQFSFFVENRNNFLFVFLSRSLVNHIKSCRYPKIMKPILLSS